MPRQSRTASTTTAGSKTSQIDASAEQDRFDDNGWQQDFMADQHSEDDSEDELAAHIQQLGLSIPEGHDTGYVV
jgi:hypothetical protein